MENKKNKKKTLGKGLDAIFGGGLDTLINDIEKGKSGVEEVLLKHIIPNPNQPRRTFDKEKLQELASSITKNGVISPIVLKEAAGSKFYIIAGERRFRASKLAKKTKIPALILDVSERKMQEMALIENIQREDLNPIEEAMAISKLIAQYKIKQDILAKALGKSRSYISNSIRILKLDQKIIDSVLNGKITFGHAKPLVALQPDKALKVLGRILEESLTVRNVENICQGYSLGALRKKKKIIIPKDPKLEYAETLVRDKIKTRVEITHNKIIIKYKGTDQLNRIMKRMGAIED